MILAASGSIAVARRFQGISPEALHFARQPGEGYWRMSKHQKSRFGGGIGEPNVDRSPVFLFQPTNR